eukprot:g30299.t1
MALLSDRDLEVLFVAAGADAPGLVKYQEFITYLWSEDEDARARGLWEDAIKKARLKASRTFGFICVDQDKDGRVSFDEAKLLICQSLRCAADLTKAPSPTQEEVRLAFDAHDTLVEGRGRMGVDEFRWLRYAAKIIHEPVDRCAEALRRSAQRLPDLWIFFVSPFTWDEALLEPKAMLALQKAMTRPWLLAAGLPIQGRDGLWQWPARQLRYRFYKLQYRRASFETGDPEDNCWAGEASSGTRLYRPGALPALLQKTITTDVATMMVELDLLAKLGKIPPRWSTRPKRRHRHRQRESASVPRGQILTCAVGAVSREEDYAQSAQLPEPWINGDARRRAWALRS